MGNVVHLVQCSRVPINGLPTLKISTMFLIAGIGSTTRWLLIALIPYTSIFVGTQLLHAASFGVAHFASLNTFLKNYPITKSLPHRGCMQHLR
jgi:hypothetical protein